jgi:hypothetical protein
VTYRFVWKRGYAPRLELERRLYLLEDGLGVLEIEDQDVSVRCANHHEGVFYAHSIYPFRQLLSVHWLI